MDKGFGSKIKTWALAGPRLVCKTMRFGFDSHPSLQYTPPGKIYNAAYNSGRSLGEHMRRVFNRGSRFKYWRVFCSGIVQGAHPPPKQFTAKETSDAKLMMDKHHKLVDALTQNSELRDRLIAVSKELSAIKRAK